MLQRNRREQPQGRESCSDHSWRLGCVNIAMESGWKRHWVEKDCVHCNRIDKKREEVSIAMKHKGADPGKRVLQ